MIPYGYKVRLKGIFTKDAHRCASGFIIPNFLDDVQFGKERESKSNFVLWDKDKLEGKNFSGMYWDGELEVLDPIFVLFRIVG